MRAFININVMQYMYAHDHMYDRYFKDLEVHVGHRQ